MADQATDWIEHEGGHCPVPKHTRVDVRFRGHEPSFGREAWEHDDVLPTFSCWHHSTSEPDTSDIIAYRVVPA